MALVSLTRSPGGSIPDLVDGFRGTNRYLFDYLSEGVLASLAPEERWFLLGSSILEQMSPDLCAALLDIDNSTAGAHTARGMICVERGESERAKAHYDAALSISERTGMGSLMAGAPGTTWQSGISELPAKWRVARQARLL